MKIAIMQPYIFPYIGYFQLINSVDKFVVLDDVNFIKKGWINRNRILVNGEEHIFTIPLIKASQNRHINNIELSFQNNWKSKLLKTIETSYKKAPYFDSAFDLIRKCILAEHTNLSLYIQNTLIYILEYIEVQTEFLGTSSVYNVDKIKGMAKILEICKMENSTAYINPVGGINLYDKTLFKENKIILQFLKPGNIEYKQFNNSFIPFLSIVDVLMFNSKSKIKEYLDIYELI